MSDDVWDANADQVNSIEVGSSQQTVEGELSAQDVRDAASSNGVKNFKLEDADTGESLSTDDFPYDGSVKVKEYNENA